MERDTNKYISELEFGKALCELNVYNNAMASGVPPYKTGEELQELKDKVRNFVKERDNESGEAKMSWTIPSNEEADEFTMAYLSAEESYYEEQVQPVTEKDRNDVLDWLNEIVNQYEVDMNKINKETGALKLTHEATLFKSFTCPHCKNVIRDVKNKEEEFDCPYCGQRLKK